MLRYAVLVGGRRKRVKGNDVMERRIRVGARSSSRFCEILTQKSNVYRISMSLSGEICNGVFVFWFCGVGCCFVDVASLNCPELS